MTISLKKYADQIGMAASGLCLVHCLLMPVLMVSWLQADHCAPGGGCCDATTGFNYDYLFLAFSAAAVWTASGHCHKTWLKAMMWGCFTLLSAALLLEPYLSGAHWATYAAAIGLAIAHFLNWRYCRYCNIKTEQHCVIKPKQQA